MKEGNNRNAEIPFIEKTLDDVEKEGNVYGNEDFAWESDHPGQGI